jgi:DNA-binding XRE family transcriptional regulator
MPARRDRRTNRARFVEKLDRSGGASACWPFRGYVEPLNGGKRGYGSFAWDDGSGGELRNVGAHVAAYRIFKGRVPARKLVMHTCNNRPCCNPRHLVAGTQKQNMEHCIASRRTATGERQHLAVMTWERVRTLRARYADGATQMELADEFEISQPTVSQITRGITWREEPAAALSA